MPAGLEVRHFQLVAAIADTGSLAAAIKNAYAIHTGMRNELPTAPDA